LPLFRTASIFNVMLTLSQTTKALSIRPSKPFGRTPKSFRLTCLPEAHESVLVELPELIAVTVSADEICGGSQASSRIRRIRCSRNVSDPSESSELLGPYAFEQLNEVFA
jgi:hypothetical protein